jgi:tetratricopeptide (TPR) repeat protein
VELPPGQWEEHKEWAEAGQVEAPGRPFAFSECRAWRHRASSAVLQICSDHNWAKGKKQTEIEELFLSPTPLLAGRSSLAENLMAFFFPQTKDILGEPIDFLNKTLHGKLTEKDIKQRLLAAEGKRFLFSLPIDPRDLRHLYTGALAPAQVILVDASSGNKEVNIDVSYARHRFGSLGVLDDGRLRWLGFAVVTANTSPPGWIKKVKAPQDFSTRPVRFLWLVGGTPDPNQADRLYHVVLAESTDENGNLDVLEEALSGLRFGPAISSPVRHLSAGKVDWLLNDESWGAFFHDPHRFEHADQPERSLSELRQLIQTGKGQEAVPQLRDLVAREPDNASYRLLLSLALFQAGDPGGAIEQGLKWSQLDPSSANSYEGQLTLGGLMFRSGRLGEAIPYLRRANELHSGEPLLLYMLGIASASQKDWATAEKSFAEFIKGNPSSPEGHSGMAEVFRHTNREKQALEEYERAMALGAAQPLVLNNAAWLYVTAKDATLRNPQKGLEYALRAVSGSDGKDAGMLDTLAEAYYVNQDYDKAIETETKALALRPDAKSFQESLEKYKAAKQAKR